MAIDFEKEVVETSHGQPVVVDFWAPWCGPCRMLGPILEKLDADSGERWTLVKIDVDEQPEPAQQFGVQGIPAVKMFHKGRVVAEFVGAQPASEVQRWLDTYLPDPGQETLATLVARWPEEGERITGELERYVAGRPDEVEAVLWLAFVVAGSDAKRASELLSSIDATVDQEEHWRGVRAVVTLMAGLDDAPEGAAPLLEAARVAFTRHDLDTMLEKLIEAVTIDRSYRDELSRYAALAVFHGLGGNHELTREHRRRLAMALHA